MSVDTDIIWICAADTNMSWKFKHLNRLPSAPSPIHLLGLTMILILIKNSQRTPNKLLNLLSMHRTMIYWRLRYAIQTTLCQDYLKESCCNVVRIVYRNHQYIIVPFNFFICHRRRWSLRQELSDGLFIYIHILILHTIYSYIYTDIHITHNILLYICI